ncbi:DoxX family membrane protein [Marinoscillum sp. MHG1-6]|uniref:DoxX family membrane protein n=1 Tax=Marinoscillum sp. MHG1-6 TaxID=2959627 RepID=UPI00215704FC|nr:DoxX family membrane protein [Marinoscillum sp. MHG1-6]
MKIAVTIIRLLLGALLIFSSVSYFFNLIPVPELSGPLKEFNEGVEATGYLLPLIKGVELLCGLAMLTGYFLPLAVVIFFPVAVNIICIHLAIAPEGIPIAVFVILSTVFLALANKDYYKSMLVIK